MHNGGQEGCNFLFLGSMRSNVPALVPVPTLAGCSNGSECGESFEPATPPERRREELACSENWENQRLHRENSCVL